jgi:hypothetical protein
MLIKSNNGHFWHGKSITAEEYATILAMLRNPPAAPTGYGYRLTEGLEWELYELPTPDPDPELTAEEALEIIMGGKNA